MCSNILYRNLTTVEIWPPDLLFLVTVAKGKVAWLLVLPADGHFYGGLPVMGNMNDCFNQEVTVNPHDLL